MSMIFNWIRKHKFIALIMALFFFVSYPFILAFLFNLIKRYKLYPALSFDFDKLGIFGDIFGSLNSIFSGGALLGVIISLHIQQRELKLQRKELKDSRSVFIKQRFDYYFFEDLSRLREVRNSIFIKGGKEYSFKINKKTFYFKTENDAWGDHAFYILSQWCRDKFYEIKSDKANGNDSKSQYEKLYDKFLYDFLGSYYRVIYNLIKSIDLSEELNSSDKEKYVHLLRAELSNSELFFLIHNGLSHYGKKFKPLLEKYAMFEHFHDNEVSITLLIKYDFEKALGDSHLVNECREHIKKVNGNPNRKNDEKF